MHILRNILRSVILKYKIDPSCSRSVGLIVTYAMSHAHNDKNSTDLKSEPYIMNNVD